MPHNFEPVTVRVGIHSGSCTSGLVGTKLPKISIFGDTMNTVSRDKLLCSLYLGLISQLAWQRT